MTTINSDLSSNETCEYYFNEKSSNQKEIVSKKFLINKLNYVNFQEKIIFCNFVDRINNNNFSIKIKPEPCIGNYLVGLWPKDADMNTIIDRCGFKELVIPAGTRNIIVEPDIRYINKNGFCLSLPETCALMPAGNYELNNLSLVDIQIDQGDTIISAALVDFTGHTIVVAIDICDVDLFKTIKLDQPIRLTYLREGDELFEGRYKVVQYAAGNISMSVVIKPEAHVIPRREPKRHRNHRYNLAPTPEISFRHPFNSGLGIMKIVDVSGSGFSVEAVHGSPLLISGMIINDLELNFAGLLKLNCTVQVVHRTIIKKEGEEDWIKFGFSIIDIPLDDHAILLELLNQVDSSDLKICARVSPDELWDFFFESGFIYQKKYRMFLENKKGIRKTYGKLYMEKATISRHFTCHEQNRLIGHMSTLWFSGDSWLIHHHAALKGQGVKAGLAVLNLLVQYLNNVEWLEKYHMKYLFCYFQPDSVFPNYFFSRFTEELGDPQKSSTDKFAYAYFRKPINNFEKLINDWALVCADQDDLDILNDYYCKVSNGLLLKVLGIEAIITRPSLLDTTYHKAGFKKEHHLWALKFKGELKAVFVVNLSDFGLNMSDFTNCISMVVVDSDEIDREITDLMLNRLSRYFEQKKFPVLYYPSTFADEKGIEYQRQYKMWAFDLKASDEYIDFLEDINRMSREKTNKNN